MAYSFTRVHDKAKIWLPMMGWYDVKVAAKKAGWQPAGSIPSQWYDENDKPKNDPTSYPPDHPARWYSFNDGWEITADDCKNLAAAIARTTEPDLRSDYREKLVEFFGNAPEGVTCH